MTSDVISTLVTASGSAIVAIIIAAMTYWLTKQRERDAELRKEKLEHYKDFVASLNGVVSGEYTVEDQRTFARACNKLNLVAPYSVIKALQDFQQGIKPTSLLSSDQHNKLISALFYEIRRDLRVSPKDDASIFQVGIWASGVSIKKR